MCLLSLPFTEPKIKAIMTPIFVYKIIIYLLKIIYLNSGIFCEGKGISLSAQSDSFALDQVGKCWLEIYERVKALYQGSTIGGTVCFVQALARHRINGYKKYMAAHCGKSLIHRRKRFRFDVFEYFNRLCVQRFHCR